MYRLSVGALFRNETHILREWIEHYLHHGVEHFYLINDGSTDSYMEILQPYIDTNTVTLFDVEWSRYVGRQRDMYTRYILPHIKETDWLLIADLDEFVWTPHSIDLCHVLNSCHNVGQIQMKEYIFGSNGHIEQPKNVVNSFTMRSKEPIKCYKYFEFYTQTIWEDSGAQNIKDATKGKMEDYHLSFLGHTQFANYLYTSLFNENGKNLI
jgi:hypothetical protein